MKKRIDWKVRKRLFKVCVYLCFIWAEWWETPLTPETKHNPYWIVQFIAIVINGSTFKCNVSRSWCLRQRQDDGWTRQTAQRDASFFFFFFNVVRSWHSNTRTRLSNTQYMSLFKHVYTGRSFTSTGDRGRDVYNNRLCRLITSSLFHWQENSLLSHKRVEYMPSVSSAFKPGCCIDSYNPCAASCRA